MMRWQRCSPDRFVLTVGHIDDRPDGWAVVGSDGEEIGVEDTMTAARQRLEDHVVADVNARLKALREEREAAQ